MIRPLKTNELPLILPLVRQVQNMHVAARPAFFHSRGSDADFLAFYKAGLQEQGGFVLGALRDGKIIGYVYGLPDTRQENAFVTARRDMILDQICVDAAWRGQGIGRTLIEAFETHARSENMQGWRANHWVFNEASAALLGAMGAAPAVVVSRKDLSQA